MLKLTTLFRTTWFQLGLITFSGAVLRLWGFLHGVQENFLYHWDSQQTLSQAWEFFLGLDWTKNSWSGPVYNLFLTYLMAGLENLLRFLGYQITWSLELMAGTASLMNVFLGTATIPVLYILGNRAYNKNAGLIAAAFLSVCPLHSFHSHYPYRDVPMVFFLVITLYLCIAILDNPSLLNLTLGALGAMLTAAMKPAGVIVLTSLFVVFIIRKFWVFIGFCIVLIVLDLFSSTLSIRGISISFIISQLSQREINLFSSSFEIFKTLIQWIGLPNFFAITISIGYGMYRFRYPDIVFFVFLISAFIALATAYYIDERFMLFLLPCGFVMLGRAITDFWKIISKTKYLKIIPFSVVSGLILYAFLQSAWQGMMFSIPDTRFLSGKWAAAHLPKETRISTEAYYPLGINEWPNVSPFDPKQPVDEQAQKTDLFITSTAEHQRYFDMPYRFQKKKIFFEILEKQGFLLKHFSLDPLGFLHTTIKAYSFPKSQKPLFPGLYKSILISCPRPYDAGWNGGVSFLERGLLDRDERTFEVGWGHRYTSTLVSSSTGQEMIVFMINGSEKSMVKVRVGYTTKTRTLKPGEFHILKFRPKWFFPKKPALYHFEAGLPEGKKVFFQLRCGNREIGEAYSKWGEYEKAVTYLKQALADDPNNPDILLLLSINYDKLGRSAEARQTAKRVIEKNPDYINLMLKLGKSDISVAEWEQLFQDHTGLKPSLLTYALSQEFTIDKAFPSPSGSGEIKEDCRASGGKTITYEKTGHKPDEIMHGPYVHLDQGAFRAGFFIRTWNVKGAESFAIIKVLADNKVIASQSVSVKDFKNRELPFKEIQIPFVHANPRAEIKFQIFAAGSGSFAVEKIRIEPDLRKTFEEKLSQLKSISKYQ